jgi:integrase
LYHIYPQPFGDIPMALSDRKAKQAKPKEKDYKLTDEKGMFLLVKKNGSKYWRLKYRFDGKEKMLALGVYPDIGLADARKKRSDARTQIANGIDPTEVKKREKRAKKLKAENTFEIIAREWWKNQKGNWTEGYTDRVMNSFEVDIFPQFGSKAIIDIDPQDVLTAIRKVEGRGALDVAGRLLQRCSKVFRYAIQTGRATLNPAGDLQGTLQTRKVIHQPSLPRTELPEFLERLNVYEGTIQTRLALRFLVLTFVRSGELRGAKWEEINWDEKTWRIPGERMKMKTEHIVPLSKQAISVLDTLRPITGHYELIFPGERRRNKPISENTLLFALYRMGYKNRATPHGFRATASSILNEQNFNRDAIERQLAHMERNQVRGAYTHHAEYLKERKKIMQWWADYLDDMEHGTNVIKGKFKKKR